MDNNKYYDRIRAKAEEILQKEAQKGKNPDINEISDILHELQVHQVELEIQNEELIKIKQDLEISQKKYYDLFLHAPVSYLTLNKESIILENNFAAEKLLDAKNKIKGRSIKEFIYHPYKEDLDNYIKNLKENQQPTLLEIIMLRENGETFQARMESLLFEDPILGIKNIRMALVDLTTQKQAIEKLNQLHNLPDMIMIHNRGKILYINKEITNILGYVEKDALGKNLLEFIDPRYHTLVKENISKRISGLILKNQYDIEIFDKYGKRLFVSVKASEIMFDRVKASMVVLRDITSRKKSQQELSRLSKALNMSKDFIVLMDLNNRISNVNDSFMEALGLSSKEEIIGKNIIDITVPDYHDELRNILASTFESGSEILEFEFKTSSEYKLPVELRTSILKNSEGKTTGMIAIIRDISNRKKAELALRKSEEWNETILEHIQDGLFVYTKNKLTFCNQKATEIFGYTFEELQSLSSADLAIPEEKDKVSDFIINNFDKRNLPESFEYWFLSKNGEKKCVYNRYSVIDDDDEVPLTLIISTDISERKKMEESLLESETKFRQLTENINDVYWLRNFPGNRDEIYYISPSFTEIFGGDIATVYQKPNYFLSFIHPEDKDEVFTAMKGEKYQKYGMADSEFRIITSDGTVKWLRAKSFPVMQGDKPVKVAGVAVDITKRKEVEEKLRAAKEEAESLNIAKSKFLANISHEMRTPLNPIIGFADMLINDYNLPAEVKDIHKLILASSNNMLDVINNILDMSKIDAGDIKIENTNFTFSKFIDSIVKKIGPQAEIKKLNLIMQIDPDIPEELIGDYKKLKNILLKLLDNAIKFSHIENSNITIAARLCAPDDILIKDIDIPDNDNVFYFSVKDEGIGIPETMINSVFDVFSQADGSSTREYGGAGIGLTIVKSLVEIMNGKIYIESSPSLGTNFYFIVPLKIYN